MADVDSVRKYIFQGVTGFGEYTDGIVAGDHAELRKALFNIDNVKNVGKWVCEYNNHIQIDLDISRNERVLLNNTHLLAVSPDRGYGLCQNFVDEQFKLPDWILGFEFVPFEILKTPLKHEHYSHLSDIEVKMIRMWDYKFVGNVIFGFFD